MCTFQTQLWISSCLQAELYTLCSFSSNFTACLYALRDQRRPPQRQRRTSWTLCFCWDVALYMLSDWTLDVALSLVHVLTVWHVAHGGLKRKLYFVFELQRPFLVYMVDAPDACLGNVWVRFFCVIVGSCFLCGAYTVICCSRWNKSSAVWGYPTGKKEGVTYITNQTN